MHQTMSATFPLAAPSVPMVAYSIASAVVATGRSRVRIYRAIRDGELKARKDGRAVMIEHAELARWIADMPEARSASEVAA
jgi:excisionase family DNA binding protein